MTTLHDAVEIDRTEPGWLRRAWEAGRASPHSPDLQVGAGFLLEGDIPEILERYICEKPAAGLEPGDSRILDFAGLDSPAATALLRALPPASLEQDFTGYAPAVGVTLQAVADNPGTVLAGGSVISPELPGETVRVNKLSVLDPALLEGVPDVVAGELPAWLDELPPPERADYLEQRQGCLDHGVTRQAWVTAVMRYDIREARRFPFTRILTNAETGASTGVMFAW